MIKILKFYFKWISKVAPTLSAKLALKLFFTPQNTPQTEDEIASEKKGQTKIITTTQGQVKTVFWKSETKDAETILLSHGLHGHGTQLYKFVEPLQKNFNVVTLDLPAHGGSSGKMTTLTHCSIALAEICKEFKVSSVIAHSFSTGAAPIAMVKHGVILKSMILIAPVFSVESAVTNFCQYMKIPKNILNILLRLMEDSKWIGKSLRQLSFQDIGPKLEIPVLVFHSKDDRFISYVEGEQVVATLRQPTFILLEGLGHYRLLQDEQLIATTNDFINSVHT